jgi:ArsR family transcriptional regulator, lead/cadmium/zinc/bismuth-responsive transcriptional repressor
MTVRLKPIDPEGVTRARRAVPTDALLLVVVETFEALADPTRARLLYALRKRSLCVRDLAVVTGVSESAVSHQLRYLKDRRLVKSQQSGNVVIYSIDDHHLGALFREAEYHADHVRHHRPDHPYVRH